MTKDEKQKVVEEFVGIFTKPGVYLMDFKGLNVAEMNELRSKMREANISMRVVKNTLAKRALESAGVEGLDEYFVGPTGVVWAEADSTAPAKVLLDFLEESKKGEVKGGRVEGDLVSIEEITKLSKLPSLQELYAQVASTLNAPIVNMARSLNAVPTKLARTVDALRVKKEEEAG
jgi:large subunit ribosomal protein L10